MKIHKIFRAGVYKASEQQFWVKKIAWGELCSNFLLMVVSPLNYIIRLQGKTIILYSCHNFVSSFCNVLSQDPMQDYCCVSNTVFQQVLSLDTPYLVPWAMVHLHASVTNRRDGILSQSFQDSPVKGDTKNIACSLAKGPKVTHTNQEHQVKKNVFIFLQYIGSHKNRSPINQVSLTPQTHLKKLQLTLSPENIFPFLLVCATHKFYSDIINKMFLVYDKNKGDLLLWSNIPSLLPNLKCNLF